jgi:hypothetical protein
MYLQTLNDKRSNSGEEKHRTHVSCPNGPCSNLNARAISGAFDAQLTTCRALNGNRGHGVRWAAHHFRFVRSGV